MQVISIAKENEVNELRRILEQSISQLKKEYINLEIKDGSYGESYFLECNWEEKEGMDNEFKSILAKSISKVILEYWKKDFLIDIIKEMSSYFDNVEQNIVCNYINKIIQEEKNKVNFPIMEEEIYDFLKENNHFNLNGFICFRLKDYGLKLRIIVEQTIDDFLLGQEYREFIHLLQDFMDEQNYSLEKIHIIYKLDGDFQLYDKNYQIIKEDYLNGVKLELVGGNVQYEEILISTLLTLLPQKVTIHSQGVIFPSHTLMMLENIFQKDLEKCNGCDFCKLK